MLISKPIIRYLEVSKRMMEFRFDFWSESLQYVEDIALKKSPRILNENKK